MVVGYRDLACIRIGDAMLADNEQDRSSQALIALAAVGIAILDQLQVQNEHLEAIRNHLDDIGTTLLNAAGAGGAIKVDDQGRLV